MHRTAKHLRVLCASVVILLFSAPSRGEDVRGDLTDRASSQRTIEKARTLGEQATQAPPAEREVIWAAAHEACAAFLKSYPDNPRRILVELQDALLWLSAGELLRQEAEVIADSQQLVDQARTDLRKAIRQLTDLQPSVDEALRLRHAAPLPDNGQLSADELMSLQKTIRFHLGRARQNQARCYPLDSADRTNSLTAALEEFRRLASLSVADDIVWQSRIEEPVCYRLLGDLAAARERLTKLPGQRPPDDVLARVQAEEIRLQLASGQVNDAIQLAGARGDTRSADLDYARLQAFLAARKAAAQAGRRRQIGQWEQRAVELIKQIQAKYGPYWMRRAETLLASRVTVGASDIGTLQRAAESYYRSGQHATALATYDRAAQQARAAGDRQTAFSLASTAAAIEQHAGRHEHALARFRRLAAEMRDDPRAATAHLSAIVNAAELARAAETDKRSVLLDQYDTLMREHIQRWPNAESSDQVHWWSAAHRESQRRWPDAIKAYRAIGSDFTGYEQAQLGAARCYMRWLAKSDESSGAAASQHQRSSVREAALTFLEDELLSGDQSVSLDLRRQAAVAAAQIRLRYEEDGFQPAEKLLAAATEVTSKASPEWHSRTGALLVLAIAGQGDVERAKSLLDGITAPQTEEHLLLVERLLDLAGASDEPRADALANLALAAVVQLRGVRPEQGGPTGTNVDRLSSLRAVALAATGRHDDALAAYDKLIAQHPKRGDFRESRARLLLDSATGGAASSDETLLGEARTAWHDVEQKSRRGTDRWFRARLARAQIEFQLGDPDAAAKVIRLTEALYPALGGEKLKAEFHSTLQKCK